jgi:predicted RNA-binding Zn-ribbon protein involved in translation (DUF1610 family)
MAAVEWNCQYCGAAGRLPDDVDIDEFQCPDCGEPVYPGT